MSIRAQVVGQGHANPKRCVPNTQLNEYAQQRLGKEFDLESSDDWIVERTGIKQRYVCDWDETSMTLGAEAARRALAAAGLNAEELDLVVCATVTPDLPFPATACLIQAELGACNAGAYDIGAACAGFIYALSTASAMIETGQIKSALVVGVDTLSKTVDWTDRRTCVLFGDGAGAVVLKANTSDDRGVIKTVLYSDGSGAKHLKIDAGGWRYPVEHPDYSSHNHRVHMAGQEVYKFAVKAMGDACIKVLDKAGYAPEQVDMFVPHQANIRIIESASNRLKLPPEKVFINIERYANLSGGSIPLALSEASEKGLLKPGMLVLTVGFGAGLVWGANLIRW